MLKNHHTPVVILALNLESKSSELAAIKSLGLDSVFIAQVNGAYKGQTERAYMFDVGRSGEYAGELNISALQSCLNAAAAYGQESILLLDYRRNAQLIFTDGSTRGLGQWRRICPVEALTLDAYTELGGHYYAAV